MCMSRPVAFRYFCKKAASRCPPRAVRRHLALPLPAFHLVPPHAAGADLSRGTGTWPASRHPAGLGRPSARSLRDVPAHSHYALGRARGRTHRHAGEHSGLREGERADQAQAPGQGRVVPLARAVSARRVVDLRGARGESLVKVKVYVEGGGDSKDLRTRCRMGFSSFFEKANFAGRMPRIIACGGRGTAFDRFRTALRSRREDEFIVLLVDSEDPIAEGSGTWEHLAGRDGWDTPADAADERCPSDGPMHGGVVPG